MSDSYFRHQLLLLFLLYVCSIVLRGERGGETEGCPLWTLLLSCSQELSPHITEASKLLLCTYYNGTSNIQYCIVRTLI